MADVKSTVANSATVRATVSESRNEVSASTRSSLVIARKLEEITDINSADLSDGSVLVYNSGREQWDTTLLLDKQNMDAGEY